MNRCEKGKIYQIVDVGYNKCYIGSTCETLSRRMARHREHYKKHLEGNCRKHERSMMLFDEFGLENCKIELIKEFPCNNRAELEREEGKEILNNIDKCVNKNVVGRTPKEYYKDNQARLLQNKREHRINNIEQYKEKDRRYNEKNKDKISEKRKNNYEKNKEAINERNKENYRKHRDKYLAQQKQPFHCECGTSCVWNVKARHFRSMRHQNWLKQHQEQLEQEPQVEEQK